MQLLLRHSSSSSQSSLCTSCYRRLATTEYQSLFGPVSQVRGKNTLVKKRQTINVKLLKDVKGYGKKGSVVPVAPGLFRNTWYPRGRAEYISEWMEARKPAERDFDFGSSSQTRSRMATKESATVASVVPKIRLISAARTSELLTELLPAVLEYERPVIEAPASAPTDQAATSTTLTYIQEASTTSIYGSVSGQDVAELIKSLLEKSANSEAQTIVLGATDVRLTTIPGNETSTILEGEGETSRIKGLGEYALEIRVKGASESIRRTVKVSAVDSAKDI